MAQEYNIFLGFCLNVQAATLAYQLRATQSSCLSLVSALGVASGALLSSVRQVNPLNWNKLGSSFYCYEL